MSILRTVSRCLKVLTKPSVSSCFFTNGTNFFFFFYHFKKSTVINNFNDILIFFFNLLKEAAVIIEPDMANVAESINRQKRIVWVDMEVCFHHFFN